MQFEYITEPQDIQEIHGRLLVLLSEADQEVFLHELNKRTETFCGAVFPALISSGERTERGALIAKLNDSCADVLIKDIVQPDLKDIERLSSKRTIFCFVDAFSESLETFIHNTFTYLDDGVRMLGGGAGKLTLKQEPVVFDNSGIYSNAAVMIGADHEIGLGVGHGWKKIDGPFLVTGSQGRSLQSLDYESAKDFYSALVLQHSGTDPRKGDFFAAAKSYPIGVITEDEEMVVRDPITIDGNAVSLVGDIHEYAVTHLLFGDTPSLLEAARSVSKMALSELGEKTPETVFIVDCISRSIFLDSDFQKELDAIRSEINLQIPISGALTLGEIASKDDRFIRFHNKTCVVAIQ